jgi:hypothetical protein
MYVKSPNYDNSGCSRYYGKLMINEVFGSGQVVPIVSSGHGLISITWSDEGKEEIHLALMDNYNDSS